jgi:hypothetical protein
MRYLVSILAVVLATFAVPFGQPAVAAPGYPSPGAGTAFLDHDALLSGYAEPDWYQANIPFVDLPDQQLQDVYYYRWRVWKEHLQYTNSGNGYILTEFLNDPGYAAAYGGINAAAGHHIYEGRWLRDRRYLDDYIRYWMYGAGYARRHQYSFWAADSIYARALVTGDLDFVKQLQPWLVSQYRGWDDHFNSDLGLYWQTPLLDATEFNYASYQTGDHFGGGAGYRPTINAYQYADARAISRIATLNGVGFGIVELETLRQPQFYTLVNRNSGKCVDVDSGRLDDGAHVRQWSCNGTVAQQFEVVPTSGGYSVIRSVNSGKVLDVDGVSTADGANVWQWTYLNGNNQHWRLEATGDGWYRIVAQHSGKALDVAGCGTADGTDIRQWTSLDNWCQHFKLQPV